MDGAFGQPISRLGESRRPSMNTSIRTEGSCLRGLVKRCPVTASSKVTGRLNIPCRETITTALERRAWTTAALKYLDSLCWVVQGN